MFSACFGGVGIHSLTWAQNLAAAELTIRRSTIRGGKIKRG